MSDDRLYIMYCIKCECISEPMTHLEAHLRAKLHQEQGLGCTPKVEAFVPHNERPKCERCDCPLPTETEKQASPEGWGEDLCWGDPIVCDKRYKKTHKVKLALEAEISYDHAKKIEDCLRWLAEGPLLDKKEKDAFHLVAAEIGDLRSVYIPKRKT